MGLPNSVAHMPTVIRRFIGRICWLDISRDMSKKAKKGLKQYLKTKSVTTMVHPHHRADLYHHDRVKDHLVGDQQALPLPAKEYHPMIQYQKRSQSQVMQDLKVCINIPLGSNTTQPYRPQTLAGRISHLGHCRRSQEWKYPFQKSRSPGVTLLRLRPPQVTQQLQYLARKYGQVQ